MDDKSALQRAGEWLWANRRVAGAALVMALPLIARYVPGFPSDEILAVVRAVVGAG